MREATGDQNAVCWRTPLKCAGAARRKACCIGDMCWVSGLPGHVAAHGAELPRCTACGGPRGGRQVAGLGERQPVQLSLRAYHAVENIFEKCIARYLTSSPWRVTEQSEQSGVKSQVAAEQADTCTLWVAQLYSPHVSKAEAEGRACAAGDLTARARGRRLEGGAGTRESTAGNGAVRRWCALRHAGAPTSSRSRAKVLGPRRSAPSGRSLRLGAFFLPLPFLPPASAAQPQGPPRHSAPPSAVSHRNPHVPCACTAHSVHHACKLPRSPHAALSLSLGAGCARQHRHRVAPRRIPAPLSTPAPEHTHSALTQDQAAEATHGRPVPLLLAHLPQLKPFHIQPTAPQ